MGRHDSASKDRLGSQASGELKTPTAEQPVAAAARSMSIGSQDDKCSMVSSMIVADNFDEDAAIFQRMIIKVPYKAKDAIRSIEKNFEQINIAGLGLESVAQLNTKELSEEEKKNRKLDYLGGFELIDREMRMYVIEGLGG